MRNPNDHQGENERVKKSEQQQVRHKTCNQEASGSLTLWSYKTTANKRAKESVLHVQNCFLLLIRPIVVFSPFPLPSPLSIT